MDAARETIDVQRKSDQILEDTTTQFESNWEELIKTGCYFPNIPVRKKVTDGAFKVSEIDNGNCVKSYKQNGKLGAGVILFWCVKHRECIGFSVLKKAESCAIVYEMLSSRFKTLPKVMIYDNACNLFEVHFY